MTLTVRLANLELLWNFLFFILKLSRLPSVGGFIAGGDVCIGSSVHQRHSRHQNYTYMFYLSMN